MCVSVRGVVEERTNVWLPILEWLSGVFNVKSQNDDSGFMGCGVEK